MTAIQELFKLLGEYEKEACEGLLRSKLEDMQELDRLGFYNPIEDNWQAKRKFSTSRRKIAKKGASVNCFGLQNGATFGELMKRWRISKADADHMPAHMPGPAQLTEAERKQIAEYAANFRWKKLPPNPLDKPRKSSQ